MHMLSVSRNHTTAVAAWTTVPCNANIRIQVDTFGGYTALHWAAEAGHKNVVEVQTSQCRIGTPPS